MYSYSESFEGAVKSYYVFYNGSALVAARLDTDFPDKGKLFFGLPCALGQPIGTTLLGKRKDFSSSVTSHFHIASKEEQSNLPRLKGTLSFCEDNDKFTFTADPSTLPNQRSFKINLKAGSFTKEGLGIGSSVNLTVSTRFANTGRRILMVEKLYPSSAESDVQARSPYVFHTPDPVLAALKGTLHFALAIGPRESHVIPVISQDDFFSLKIHPTTPPKVVYDFAVNKYLTLSKEEKDAGLKEVWKAFHSRLVRKAESNTAHTLFIPGMFPELTTRLCEFLAKSFVRQSKLQKAFLLVTLDPLTDAKNHVELNFPLVSPTTSLSLRRLDTEVNLFLLFDGPGGAHPISTVAKLGINEIGGESGSDLSRITSAPPLPLSD